MSFKWESEKIAEWRLKARHDGLDENERLLYQDYQQTLALAEAEADGNASEAKLSEGRLKKSAILRGVMSLALVALIGMYAMTGCKLSESLLLVPYTTYVVTRNADAERMASEAKSIGVNVNQIARALNAESKLHPGSLSPGVLGELSKLTDEVDGLRTDFSKDVFRAMALLWPDVPEQLEELCDYWYGERGEKILIGGGGS